MNTKRIAAIILASLALMATTHAATYSNVLSAAVFASAETNIVTWHDTYQHLDTDRESTWIDATDRNAQAVAGTWLQYAQKVVYWQNLRPNPYYEWIRETWRYEVSKSGTNLVYRESYKLDSREGGQTYYGQWQVGGAGYAWLMRPGTCIQNTLTTYSGIPGWLVTTQNVTISKWIYDSTGFPGEGVSTLIALAWDAYDQMISVDFGDTARGPGKIGVFVANGGPYVIVRLTGVVSY